MRSRVSTINALACIALCCGGFSAYAQKKVIRSIVYEAGKDKTFNVKSRIDRFKDGVGFIKGLQFYPVDTCDCAKVKRIRIVPDPAALYEPRDIECADISPTIAVVAKHKFVASRKSANSRGYTSEADSTFPSFEIYNPVIVNTVRRILSQIGLATIVDERRMVFEAAPVRVARAQFEGEKHYLYYNPDVLAQLANNDAYTTGILAHELAHHLLLESKDVANETNEQRVKSELAADRWSGLILFKLRVSLDSALMLASYMHEDTSTLHYPGRSTRLETIKEGWIEGSELARQKMDGKDYQLYFNNGLKLYRAEEYSKALPQLTIAINLDPTSWDAYLYRGISSYYLGNYATALIDLNNYISKDSSSTIALRYRSAVRSKFNDFAGATSDINRVFELEGPNYSNYFFMSMALSAKSLFAESNAYLDSAISIDPSRAETYHFKGRNYGLMDVKSATRYFLKALEIDRANLEKRGLQIDSMNLKGDIYFLLFTLHNKCLADSAYRDSLRYYTVYAKSILDDYYYTDFSMGAYYNSIRNYAEAERHFSRAIARMPADKQSYMMRAYAFAHLKRYDEAARDYSEVIRAQEPQTLLVAYELRAQMLIFLKKFEEATLDCDELIKRNPGWAFNHNYKSLCAIYLNRLDVASEGLAKSESIMNVWYTTMYIRALLFYRQQRYDEALTKINQAIPLFIQNDALHLGCTKAEFLYLKACILHKQGSERQASSARRDALQLGLNTAFYDASSFELPFVR